MTLAFYSFGQPLGTSKQSVDNAHYRPCIRSRVYSRFSGEGGGGGVLRNKRCNGKYRKRGPCVNNLVSKLTFMLKYK